MLLGICLICIHHTVKPWQKLFGAVIGVEHDGDAIDRSNGANVVSSGDSSGDRGGLIFVVKSLYTRSDIE